MLANALSAKSCEIMELGEFVCSAKKSNAPYSLGRVMLRSKFGLSTRQFCKRVATKLIVYLFLIVNNVYCVRGLTLSPLLTLLLWQSYNIIFFPCCIHGILVSA